MFKVNKLTDYATVILINMAHSDLVRPTQVISDSTGIPLPTVAKLMKNLVKAGLIVSYRGVRGGYILNRPPDEVTIADVIEAIEGPIALTPCVDTSAEQCCYENLCPVHGKWNRVNNAVTHALREVTLADMDDGLSIFVRGSGQHAKSSDNSTQVLQQE